MNGLSEWQHFNSLNMTNRIQKDVLKDRWTTQQSQKGKQGSKSSKKDSFRSENAFMNQPYAAGQNNGYDQSVDPQVEAQLFRESQTVSHSDAILDMAMIELDNNNYYSGNSVTMSQSGASNPFDTEAKVPLLATSSRDGTIKLWR